MEAFTNLLRNFCDYSREVVETRKSFLGILDAKEEFDKYLTESLKILDARKKPNQTKVSCCVSI